MRKILPIAGAVAFLAAGGAQATTVTDPVGDFLGSFVGQKFADLDITSFTVNFDAAQSAFDISATFNGAFDPTHTGLYIIGVDTGAGAIRPFAGIGEGNVAFDQVIAVQNTGAASLGANVLTTTLSSDSFSLVAPSALLTGTAGVTDPRDFRFSFWSRTGLGNNNQNADFAPDNATVASVPEPASWAMMIGGFGLVGAAARRRRAAAAA
jgi:hypothetical protein